MIRKWPFWLLTNSIQFNSIQFNSIQFNSIQFNSIQFNFISIKHYIKIHWDKKDIYNKIIWMSRLESQWGMIIAYPLLHKQHTLIKKKKKEKKIGKQSDNDKTRQQKQDQKKGKNWLLIIFNKCFNWFQWNHSLSCLMNDKCTELTLSETESCEVLKVWCLCNESK